MNLGEFDLDPETAPSQPLRFERAPNELSAPDNARAVVREALIPLLVWQDVPVHVLKPRRLGRMETFLLEAGLRLQPLNLQELSAITSLPLDVIAQSAAKLRRRQVFREAAPGLYVVDDAEARKSLETRNIAEEELISMNFVYLPQQDQVIADPELTGSLVAATKKLRGPRRAPLLQQQSPSMGVSNFLSNRIEAGRILGTPYQILGLGAWAKPPEWPKYTPCYFGRGYVHPDATKADLQLFGHPRRKDGSSRYEGEAIKLKHSALIQEWVLLADRFRDGFRGQAEHLPAFSPWGIEPWGNRRWRIGVSDEAARLLANEHWLTEEITLSVCSPTAKVDVRVALEPVSSAAADLFALDLVARRVEERSSPYSDVAWQEHLARAKERYPYAELGGVSKTRAEHRLWSRKCFKAVYAHRGALDFAYG